MTYLKIESKFKGCTSGVWKETLYQIKGEEPEVYIRKAPDGDRG